MLKYWPCLITQKCSMLMLISGHLVSSGSISTSTTSPPTKHKPHTLPPSAKPSVASSPSSGAHSVLIPQTSFPLDVFVSSEAMLTVSFLALIARSMYRLWDRPIGPHVSPLLDCTEIHRSQLTATYIHPPSPIPHLAHNTAGSHVRGQSHLPPFWSITSQEKRTPNRDTETTTVPLLSPPPGKRLQPRPTRRLDSLPSSQPRVRALPLPPSSFLAFPIPILIIPSLYPPPPSPRPNPKKTYKKKTTKRPRTPQHVRRALGPLDRRILDRRKVPA